MFKLLTSKSKTSKKGLAPHPPPTNGGRQDPLPQHYSKPLPPSPGAHSGPVQHHQNPYPNPYPYQGHPHKKQMPQHHQLHYSQQRAPMFVPPLRSTNVQYTQFSSSAAKAAENINQRAQGGRMPPQLQNILIPPMEFELESQHQQFHYPRAPTLEGHRPASHQQLHQMHQTHNMESVPRHHSRMPSGSGEGYFSRGKGREEMPYMHMISGEARSTSMRPSVSEPPITTVRTSRALPPRPIPISIQRSESDSEPVEMIQLGRQSVLRGQPMRATISLPNTDQSQSHPQPRQPPRWKFLEDLRRKVPEPRSFPPDPVPSPQIQMVEISSEASTVEPVEEAKKDEIFKDDFKLKSFSRFEKAAEIQKQQRNIEKPKVEAPDVAENLELKQTQIKEIITLPQPPAIEKAETSKSNSPASLHKEASVQVSFNSHQETEAPTENPMQIETGESYFKRDPHLLTLLTNEFKSGTSEEHSLPIPSDIPNSPKILLRDRNLLHAASGLIHKFTALPDSSHEATIQGKYSGLSWNKSKKIESQAEAKVDTPKVESKSVVKSEPKLEDGFNISIGRSRNNNVKPRPKTVVENLRTKFEMKIQEASGNAMQSKNISTAMPEGTSLPKPVPRPTTANSARRKMTNSLGSLRRTQQSQVTNLTPLPNSKTPEDDTSQSSALKWKLEALSRKPDKIDQLEPPSFLDSIGKKTVNNNSWRPGSVSNSIASLRSPPIGLDAEGEVGDSPSLALQLEMGELRIQMEMWRKKFREEQNAKSDLEAELAAKEIRLKDLHTEETTSIKNLCSRRIRELVHVIRELQDLNLQFRTLLKENNIEIPGINTSPLMREPKIEPIFSPPLQSAPKKISRIAIAKMNFDTEAEIPPAIRSAPISSAKPVGSLTPITMYKFIEEQYRQIVQNDSTEIKDTLPLSSSSNSSEFLLNSQDTDSRINQLLSSIERTATAMAEMDSARLPRRSNFSLNTPSGHDLNKSFYSQRDANRSHPNFTYPNEEDVSSNESSPKHSRTPSLKYSPESVSEQEDHPVSIPESNPQHKLKTRLAPSLSSLSLNLNIPSAHRTTHSPLTPNHSAKDYPIDLSGLAESLKATAPSKLPTNRQPPPASSTRIAYHAHTKPNNCHRPLPQLPDAIFSTST